MKFKVINRVTNQYEKGEFYLGQNGKLYKQIVSGYEGNTMLIDVSNYYDVEFFN